MRRRRAGVAAAAPSPPPEGAAAGGGEETPRPMNLVFVAAEVAPWSKTGGLGDVLGGLPIELARRGHKVMSIAPRYDQYRDGWDTNITVKVLGESVRFFHCHKKGVDRVFVDHPWFLAKVWGKTGSKLYGEKTAADYVDNPKRFSLFCRAAIEAARVLPFGFDGEAATFIANDWHSALVPVLLKKVYQPRGEFAESKVALCVHNIAFQGRFFEDKYEQMGLPAELKPLFDFIDGYPICFDETNYVPDPDKYMREVAASEGAGAQGKGGLKKTYRKINWLKAAFLTADKNLTVSPNYAKEIMSGVDKGVELDDVVRSVGGIEGIVNGMDPSEWSPEVDKFIDVNYDIASLAEGKAAAKQELQAELGLAVDPDIPLLGFIGRLEEQKGVDIMLSALPTILKESECQVVVLGTGKKVFERMVRGMEDISPNAKGIVQFSAPLAHLITGGADFMLVPSRFEPCGLIQLHAMRYGTVPIVSSTGGLVDTVKEGRTGYHIGRMDADDLLPEDVDLVATTVARAIGDFGTAKFEAMREKCMQADVTWAKPAKKWEGVLELLQFGDDEAGSVSSKKEVTTPAQEM